MNQDPRQRGGNLVHLPRPQDGPQVPRENLPAFAPLTDTEAQTLAELIAELPAHALRAQATLGVHGALRLTE